MKKTTVNFVLDSALLLIMTVLISTGLLIKYILPPGSGGHGGVSHGEGELGEHSSALLGFGRHDWGSVHFWLAVALISGLVVHLILHWRWVLAMIRRPSAHLSEAQSHVRNRLAVAAGGLLGLIILAPWLIPVSEAASLRLEAGEIPQTTVEINDDIRGSMTLREVEGTTGVPVQVLLETLQLPDAISPDERLGRLHQFHGFALSDVREVVRQWSTSHPQPPNSQAPAGEESTMRSLGAGS